MVRRACTHAPRHRVRAALSLTGFALVFSGTCVAWMAGAQAGPASATTLPADSLALHNAVAGPADSCPGDGAFWHFVLTPNDDRSSFAVIVLDVGGDIFSFTGFPPIVANGAQTDNVFVPVPPGHTVTDLETTGSYATYSGGDPSHFVLSGVCGGDDDAPTTTTAAPVPPPDGPTTTTTTAAPVPPPDGPTTTTTTAAPVPPPDGPTTTTQSTTLGVGVTPTTGSVVLPGAAQPPPAPSTSSTPVAGPPQLASTGSDTGLLASTAAALIGLGFVSLAFGNRRTGARSER